MCEASWRAVASSGRSRLMPHHPLLIHRAAEKGSQRIEPIYPTMEEDGAPSGEAQREDLSEPDYGEVYSPLRDRGHMLALHGPGPRRSPPPAQLARGPTQGLETGPSVQRMGQPSPTSTCSADPQRHRGQARRRRAALRLGEDAGPDPGAALLNYGTAEPRPKQS